MFKKPSISGDNLMAKSHNFKPPKVNLQQLTWHRSTTLMWYKKLYDNYLYSCNNLHLKLYDNHLYSCNNLDSTYKPYLCPLLFAYCAFLKSI